MSNEHRSTGDVEIKVFGLSDAPVIADNGNTELHNACEDNLVNKVKLLCESGADVNVVNNKGMTPLDIVSKVKDFPYPRAIIDILKLYGAMESNSQEGEAS